MALRGKRLVTVSEIANSQKLDAALIKDLTGGDTVVGRSLYGVEVNFKAICKIWMAGNYKPEIRDMDEGIWRRVRLIPFDVFIPQEERDPALQRKLLEELPGIMNWALKGLRLWMNNENGLPLPKAIQDASTGYRAEMNVIQQFIDERCDVDPKKSCLMGPLYQAFDSFCIENGQRTNTLKEFAAELDRCGFLKGKRGINQWCGLV